MQIRELFADDDAVSPVIGVILMVAITVILAAVIGAFVLGFGGSTSSAPSVQWETSNNDTHVIFGHGGGDDVSSAEDVFSIQSPANSTDSPTVSGDDGVLSTTEELSATYGGSSDDLGDMDSGAEVEVLWSGGGDSSQVVATHTL